MLIVILAFVLAYLVGSIPFSIITCKVLKGIDIREHGSGNAGATNVYRIMGFKVALFVLILDALKGVFGVFVPVLLIGKYAPDLLLSVKDYNLMILGGLLSIFGHIWTIFAGFKGGKGIGTSLGVFFAILWLPTLISFISWIIAVKISKIVSLASIIAGIVLFLASLASFLLLKDSLPLSYLIFTAFSMFLILFTHRSNIKRLLDGTEKKITKKKESE